MLNIFVEVTEAFGQEVSIKNTKVKVISSKSTKIALAGEEFSVDIPVKFIIKGQVLKNIVTFMGVKENVILISNMRSNVDLRECLQLLKFYGKGYFRIRGFV